MNRPNPTRLGHRGFFSDQKLGRGPFVGGSRPYSPGYSQKHMDPVNGSSLTNTAVTLNTTPGTWYDIVKPETLSFTSYSLIPVGVSTRYKHTCWRSFSTPTVPILLEGTNHYEVRKTECNNHSLNFILANILKGPSLVNLQTQNKESLRRDTEQTVND